MKNRIILSVTLIFLELCSYGVSYAQTNISDAFDLMKSSDFGARKQAIDHFDRQRQKVIDQSIAILASNASPDLKDSAAQLLGAYRASEAVNILNENIVLDTRTRTFKGVLWEIQPVTTALEKIGTPSIPAVIKNLQESDDAKVRELSLTALYTIEGDKDVVQLRLQKALDAQPDATKKIRLLAALKSLPEIKIIQSGVGN